MTKRKSKRKGRFSARKKAEAVRRLVAGEDLDVLARELGQGERGSRKEALLAASQQPWRSVENRRQVVMRLDDCRDRLRRPPSWLE
tara:strand:- start:46 stop:303 length:258 start_codon:yes stop_codon:yes gene_type:complete